MELIYAALRATKDAARAVAADVARQARSGEAGDVAGDMSRDSRTATDGKYGLDSRLREWRMAGVEGVDSARRVKCSALPHSMKATINASPTTPSSTSSTSSSSSSSPPSSPSSPLSTHNVPESASETASGLLQASMLALENVRRGVEGVEGDVG
jgi:hypothetical protein